MPMLELICCRQQHLESLAAGFVCRSHCRLVLGGQAQGCMGCCMQMKGVCLPTMSSVCLFLPLTLSVFISSSFPSYPLSSFLSSSLLSVSFLPPLSICLSASALTMPAAPREGVAVVGVRLMLLLNCALCARVFVCVCMCVLVSLRVYVCRLFKFNRN